MSIYTNSTDSFQFFNGFLGFRFEYLYLVLLSALRTTSEEKPAKQTNKNKNH